MIRNLEVNGNKQNHQSSGANKNVGGFGFGFGFAS